MLAFEYKMDTQPCFDMLSLFVDGKRVTALSGKADWTTYAYRFATEGEHQIILAYQRTGYDIYAGENVQIRQVRLFKAGEEADAAMHAMPDQVKTLEDKQITILPVEQAAREVLFTDPNGDQLMDDLRFFLLAGEEAKLRLSLGKELDANLVVITVDASDELLNITAAETDAQGYLFQVPLNVTPSEGYTSTAVAAFPDPTTNPTQYSATFLFPSEEDLDAFCKTELANAAWQYAGAEEAADEANYVILVQEEDGNPCAGVMLQICDDDTCEVMATDEKGSVAFTRKPWAYEIHVLLAPGYAAYDQSETMPEKGGSLTITLKKP